MEGDLLIPRYHDHTLKTRDSTIGHWRFRGNLGEEVAGNDLQSQGVTVDDFGIGYAEPGVTALHLDGTKHAYLPAASATDYNVGTGSFTVEALVKASTVTPALHVRKADATITRGYALATASNYLVAKIADGTNGASVTSAGYALEMLAGVWYHLCMVVDREAQKLWIYINGEVAKGGASTASVGSVDIAEDLVIGADLVGAVDEVCISLEALTPAAVAERARGCLHFDHAYDPAFIKRHLPGQYHGNDALDQFLVPFGSVAGTLKAKAEAMRDMLALDRCPARFITHLASFTDFELIDSPFGSEAERRNFLKWVVWIYRRKGTAAGVEKLIELLGFAPLPILEYFPDTYPFVLNHHLLVDHAAIATASFEDPFETNLAQWESPLNTDCRWRLEGGNLIGKGSGSNDPTNAILRDDDAVKFYAEADYKIVQLGGAGNFGFYLKYVDADNWVRFQARPIGDTMVGVIVWRSGGVQSEQVIGLLPNYDLEWHRLWIYANMEDNTYTVGVDGNTNLYEYTLALPAMAAGKKGLWVDADSEVKFDHFRVQEIDRSRSATLWHAGHSYRGYTVQLEGEPDNLIAKERWLIRVINNYVPFGVHLKYNIQSEPVAVALATGSCDTKLVRSSAFALATDAGEVVYGSLLLTPGSVALAAATDMHEPIYSSPAARVATAPPLISADIEHSLFACEDTDPTNGDDFETPTELHVDDLLRNNVYTDEYHGTSTACETNWSVGFKLRNPATIHSITVWDCKANNTSDGYHADNDDWKLYISTDGETYTEHETFTSLTRVAGVTTVALATPVHAQYFKLHCYQGPLYAPDGVTDLHPIEIDAFEQVQGEAAIKNSLWKQNDTSPTSGTGFTMPEDPVDAGGDFLRNGVYETGADSVPTYWLGIHKPSVGFELTAEDTIAAVTIHDQGWDDDDSLAADFEYSVYTSGDGSTYTLQGTYTDLTRSGKTINVIFAEPLTATFFKLHQSNGGQTQTDGHRLYPVEIKAIKG